MNSSAPEVLHPQHQTGANNAGLFKSIGQLPLSFELNQGQLNRDVKFLSRGLTADIYLNSAEIVFSVRRPPQAGGSPVERNIKKGQGKGHTMFLPESKGRKNSRDLVKMKLVGGNRKAKIEGIDELHGTVNYFIGKSQENWHTNILTYRKVAYRDVYPGIDQIFYGNEQQLEFDFIVSPGANPHTIRFSVKSEGKPVIDQQGNVALRSKGSQEIRLHKPIVYQEIDGGKRVIPANYVMRGERQIGFDIAEYDLSRPLIIDPILSYSTYFGGSGNDAGFGVAVDNGGNAYVTGSTDSTELSTLSNSNVFVVKLNAAGTQREYLSIIGGAGDDTGFDISVDGTGNAHVTGATSSTNFPSINAAQSSFGGGPQDAFVARLNASGSALVYSTYLGGSSNDAGFGLTLDGSGNAFVTGSSDSVEFSSLTGTNAFVSKLNSNGNQRDYLSIVGGAQEDVGFSIAVDSFGNAYVTGSTNSSNFTTANPFQPNISGAQDAFITKLNPTGSALIFSTYFGSSGSEVGYDITVDSSGNSYVTGVTNSQEFSNLGGTDAFVVKFNAAGTERSYFSILGGSGDDVGFSIALDGTNNTYVTGSTNSTNFTTANPVQMSLGGAQDAFVAKLNPTGSSIIYSTFLGGGGNDAGVAIAVEGAGTAYVTGFTSSNDFPAVNALQLANAGNGDAFIAKILGSGITPTPTPTPTPTATPTPTPTPSSIQLILDETGPAINQVAALDSVLFLRDPFPVVNTAALLNQGSDRNTRVMIFVTNFQLAPGEPSASVIINLVSSNNQSFDIAAEDVRKVPQLDLTQIVFRLPNNLAAGTCTIKVRAHGQVSGSATMRIRS